MAETFKNVKGFQYYEVTRLEEGSIIQTGYAQMELDNVKNGSDVKKIIKDIQKVIQEAIQNPSTKLGSADAQIVDPLVISKLGHKFASDRESNSKLIRGRKI